jgi:hypothetical protein
LDILAIDNSTIHKDHQQLLDYCSIPPTDNFAATALIDLTCAEDGLSSWAEPFGMRRLKLVSTLGVAHALFRLLGPDAPER